MPLLLAPGVAGATPMIPHNVNGAGGVIVDVDRNRELALYDALPRRWRDLIDSLPVPQAIGPVIEYRAALGDEAAWRRIVGVFRAKFPGWLPPGTETRVAACARERRLQRTMRFRQRSAGR